MPTNQPDNTVYREPSTRVLQDWTPAMLRSALTLADAGTLRMAADLCEALKGDGRVRAALGQRTRGLLRLPLEFEAERKQVEKAIGEDWYEAFPEDELAQLHDWGTLLGVGLGELVWKKSGSGRDIPRLKVWHSRWLRFDWPTREWMLTVDGGSEIQVTAGDGRWILYTPGGANRPWVNGAWRSVAKAWLLKTYSVGDWARYDEVHGAPQRVAIAPQDASKEKRKEVAADIAEMGADTAIALPAGYDLKLVEATSRSWETFRESIGWACTEIAIAILGQNLTTEVQGGSFAAAGVHGKVAQHLIEADAETESTATREQALSWWAQYNFGNRDLAPWPRRKTEPPEDAKAKAETQRATGEAIKALRDAGLDVDAEAMAEKAGVPLKPPSDEPKQSGELYQYHFEFGIITVNEARAKLGLPPIAGGDELPKRIVPATEDEVPERLVETALRSGAVAAIRRGDLKTFDVLTRALASRLRAESPLPAGAVEGQGYADELAARARAAGAEALDDDLATLLANIEDATDYDDLKNRLLVLYEGMRPAKLAELTERAEVLAELAGRYSLLKDL